MKRKVTLGELNFNEELLEMRPVNDFVVSRYRQAYRAGNDLGPIGVDAHNNDIVSGNHRVRAMLAEFGEDHGITVDAHVFASEAEKIAFFARENVRHGMPLDGRSRRAIINKLAHLGVASKDVANIFGISVQRVEELNGQVVYIRGNKHGKPIKHGAEHKAGQTVTKREYARHAKQDLGVPVASLCRQLTNWLNDDWIDTNDESTLAALDDMSEALAEWKARNAVTA